LYEVDRPEVQKMQPEAVRPLSYGLLMEDTVGDYVALLLTVVVLCSFWSVKVWLDARRAEREAFYRTEAVKKIVELHGNVSEPLLDTLREAIEQKTRPSPWVHYDYNREREAYYRNETLKKVAVVNGGAAAVVEYLRNDDNRALRARAESVKLAGMMTVSLGIGMMIFMRLLDDSRPIYMVGVIPVLIGISLLVYAFGIMPSAPERKLDAGNSGRLS
jgi:hypothetical protein